MIVLNLKIKHLLLGLLSLAALASCAIKDDLQPAEPARLFRAVMEQPAPDASTKAYSDETYHLFWNYDDRVSIFFGQTFNREFAFTGDDGDTAGGFEQVGDAPSGSAPAIQSGFNYAIYPYAEANECASQGTLTVVFPEQQIFYDKGIGARPLMAARAEKGDFIFKHLGAYVGVRLVGDGVTVKSISFQGNNGETMAGPASVTFGEDGVPVLDFIAQGSPSLTMTLETPVELNMDEAKVFWLNVPAGALDGGYTLTVTDPAGGMFQKVRTDGLTLQRSYFYTLDAEVEITPVPLDESSYAKASTITAGGTYLIVDAADQRLFKGAIDGSFLNVSPVDGVITDTDGTLAAYEFTVEQSGSNYYLIFNDGKYLVSNWSSPGNGSTGLCYVDTQNDVRYPYALTISDGAFMFSTTQVNSSSSTNQVLYYKAEDNFFKIGGSGRTIGVHLYMKGGKRDRGLKFEPETVTCLQGETPEKPVLSGTYTTARYSSDNTSVATVDATSGTVTVKGIGMATITASVEEDDDYMAGEASYTLTVLDPSVSTYTKASSITVGGTYLVVDVEDKLVFTGAQTSNSTSVTPKNGVITDTERALAAYEFTVEKSGNNYYLKFNDGKYLVCNYTGSGGNSTSGVCYVGSQNEVTYPYTLTISDGTFFFNTTRTDNNEANQYIYYKTSGTNANVFKIGQSGSSVGIHLYLKGGGGDTPAKKTQTLSFTDQTVTWTLGNGYETNRDYDFPQTVTGAKTPVTYTSLTTDVVTIIGDMIHIVKAGSATIQAEAAETDEYYGNSATYTLNIASPAPEGWVDLGTFNLENKAVKDYLTYAEGAYTDTNEKTETNVVYYATNSTYSSISRKDCPAPVTITWTNPGTKSTVVTIYADQALTQQVCSQPATEGNSTTTSSDVYNLIPGLTYYYTVSENGSVWEKGQFNTTGRRRMIRVSGTQSTDKANNCRDLGGMITKDGTKRIKYGYIFRGSNMNSTTNAEKSILADFMKVRMDIDLRVSGQWGSQGASRAFPESDYPVIGYLNRGFNGYSDLSSNDGLGRIGDIFNTIIDTVLEGKAVYFHCYVGADRTGIIGVILEGMLGISEKDCSIDYELTTFSRAVGNRPRDGSENDHYFSQGLALLRGQDGSTFEQKCTNFLTSSKVGVSATKINQFKNFILENK